MTTFKVYITKLQHNYPTFWKQKTRNGTPTPHAMNTMQIMTIKNQQSKTLPIAKPASKSSLAQHAFPNMLFSSAARWLKKSFCL
jgi:hypothetical protein